MSAEQNKATVLQFYEEVWNKGKVDFAFEVFVEDYIRHDLRSTEAFPGPEGQRKIAADFRAAFPNLRWNVDLILACALTMKCFAMGFILIAVASRPGAGARPPQG